MKVPLLDISASQDPLRDQLIQAFERVLRSQTYIMGPEVEAFERAAAIYCNAAHAIGVSSGTDALLVSLMALGIHAGDEVITTPYSFFATAGVIARLGAKPVFVDIDPVTFNMNPAMIAKAITRRTKAIMPVHLFGQCADMNPILEIAQQNRFSVIEDAAQAIGVEYSGRHMAGTMGTVGCFSFFPSKNLGALGDAGLVMTADGALAEKIRAFRVHGAKQKYYHTWVGGNFRLDALQAAFLSVKLPHLNGWSQERRMNAAAYDALFEKAGISAQAKLRCPQVVHPDKDLERPHIFNQYVIRVQDRDGLKAFLTKKDIHTEIYYPVPLHLQECFASLSYRKGDFPEAEKAAAESLALPIFPGLNKRMQETVVSAIKEYYK